MEKTLKGRLLELAARLHQLPPDERRELAPAVKRAHDALPPRRPMPPNPGGTIGRGSAS